MAAGQNVPELGGYDYEFTSKVAGDLECPVCQLTMKDPIQIGGCGHRLCNICSEALLRQPTPKCPVDRQPLLRDKIFSDIACHRRILDLTVKCSFVGCTWAGELRAVEKHQSECLLKLVECPNAGCTERFTKQDMNNHKAFECSWRKVNCEYCQELFIVKNKQQHFGVCQKFPVQCTNKCVLRDIPREKLVVHIRDECPLTEIHCEYKNLGCEEVFPRTRAKSHSESQVERHLNLALRSLEATQYQVEDLVTVVKDRSQQIERLMSSIQDQSRQIEQLMVKDQYQALQIKELTTKAKSHLEDVEALKVKVNAQAQQMEKLEEKKQECKNLSEDSLPELEREAWRKRLDKSPSDSTSRHVAVCKKETGKTQAERQNFKPKTMTDIKLYVGMEVLVKMKSGKEGLGIVRAIRPPLFRPLIGVELYPGQEGNTDGTFCGDRYFTCAPNRGIFVKFEDVIQCYS